MPKWFVVAFVAAALGLTASLVVLVLLSSRRGPAELRTLPQETNPLVQDPGLEGLGVPAFSLVDQAGSPIDQSILDGHITLVDFFFTNCPYVCPTLTGAMLDLQDRLAGTPVRLLSVSVDPAHDTPERIREYASNFGADPARWVFATGDEAVVRNVLNRTLGFDIQVDPDESKRITLPDGSVMSNIIHPSKIVLIGPQRQVLALYSYQIPGELESAERRAREAARAAGLR